MVMVVVEKGVVVTVVVAKGVTVVVVKGAAVVVEKEWAATMTTSGLWMLKEPVPLCLTLAEMMTRWGQLLEQTQRRH